MNILQGTVPDSTTRPIYPTTLSAWLDKLGAYDTCEGNDRMLDLIKLLWESDAYWCNMIPFPNNISTNLNLLDPNGYVANFLPGETQTGSIQVPINSFLVHITMQVLVGDGSAGHTYVGPGFKIRIFDKATQSDLFYNQFAHNFTAGADMNSITYDVPDVPMGPYMLVSPYCTQPPGIVQLEITNLDTQNNQCIQALFAFASPKTQVAVNVVPIDKEYTPS